MKKALKIIAILLALALLLAALPLYSLFTSSLVSPNVFRPVSDLHYSQASEKLNNPSATKEAKALMQYLKSIYGKQVLSGQYIDTYQVYDEAPFLDENGQMTVLRANELVAITAENGGKLPAVLGLDFTGTEMANEQWKNYVTKQAIEWHNMGGIVTFCWHWLVPQDVNESYDRYSNATMYVKDTNYNLAQVLADKNGALYQRLLQDIDRVSEQLNILQDAGVPVLWRPLHEAGGGWFWWGGSGKEAYKELWNLMYDRMTNERGLNNLIWVFNAQRKGWYVGDDRCDIVGDDPYPMNNIKQLYALDPGRIHRFRYHNAFAGNKMILMSENAALPDIDAMFKHDTVWLSFGSWMREMTVQADPNNPPYGVTNHYSEAYTSKERLRQVYHDARVLTLDEIKDRQVANP